MKIVHVADLHQGVLTHSRALPSGVPSRIQDAGEAWIRVVEHALEIGAAAIVVAGDTFHRASPGPDELSLFAYGVREAVGEGIEILVISGNHDRAPHGGRACVLSAFERSTVHVVTRPGIVELGAGPRVACLPSVSRHELAAGLGVDRLATEEAAIDVLRFAIAGLAQEGADLLTLHYSIAGGVIGGEKDLAIIPEPMLSPADLAGPWRYTAAGHIHRRQIFGELTKRGPVKAPANPANVRPPIDGGPVAYAGSVIPISFAEADGGHGGYDVELDENRVTLEPFEIPSRPMMTFDRKTRELEIADLADFAGGIIRFRGVPRDEADELRRRSLERGAWIVKIETERPERPASAALELEEIPTPLDALARWLEDNSPKGDRDRILERARTLALES